MTNLGGGVSFAVYLFFGVFISVVAERLRVARTEKVERAHERRWAATLASIGDAVIATDMTGKITFMNAVAETVTGWSLIEASSKPVTEVFATIEERSRKKMENPVLRALREGTIVGLASNAVLIRKDGTEVPIDDSGAPIHDVDGKTTGVVLVFRDITDRRQMEEALRESELRFRLALRTAPVSVAIQDLDLRYIWAYNHRIADSERIVGKLDSDIFTAGEAERLEMVKRRVIEENVEIREQMWLDGPKGRVFLDIYCEPMRDADGRVTGVGSAAIDLTPVKLAEESLRASEHRYSALFANKINAIAHCRVITDEHGRPSDYRIMEINEAYERIVGIKKADIEGLRVKEVFPGVENYSFDYIGILGRIGLEGGEIMTETFLEPMERFLSLYAYSPAPGEFTAIFTDITERRKAEEALRASLAEKETLLKEVHHRVKNNLAAIVGLLDLQQQSISDSTAIAAFKDLQGRIKSMSLVHERLYRSKNLSRIDFADYLKALVSHLRTSLGSGNVIRCEVKSRDIEMTLDIAVPCGMIVNELVSNALKHAFPHGTCGESHCDVSVSMTKEGNIYKLAVADNGVGLPADFDWETAKSLGLRLVRMLGQHQLGGTLELDRTGGTKFTLAFNWQR